MFSLFRIIFSLISSTAQSRHFVLVFLVVVSPLNFNSTDLRSILVLTILFAQLDSPSQGQIELG